MSLSPFPAPPKPDCKTPSDRCSFQWSRDEVARYFHRVVLFRSVQSRFLFTVAGDNRHLGLGGLTFLQLTTTYAPVIAGHNIGCVFSMRTKRYTWPERFRRIQIFCVWNWCCWALRFTPLVGTAESWCATRRRVIIGKNSLIRYCTSLTASVT